MNAVKRFIGSGFGSGYSPFAPGTVGSLVVILPVYFSVWVHPVYGPLTLAIIFSLLSLWSTKACVKAWGDDPGTMVIDEFAGQALVFIGASLTFTTSDWWFLLSAFGIFRFFDILKPFGINKIQSLKGGWGILTDDLLSGFYALICLKTLIFLFHEFFGG